MIAGAPGMGPGVRAIGGGIGLAAAEEAAAGRSAADPAAGLRSQLASHEQKLADYRANPDAFDNRGILRDASPERRQAIIDGRIRNLEGQIQNFKDQIGAIENKSP